MVCGRLRQMATMPRRRPISSGLPNNLRMRSGSWARRRAGKGAGVFLSNPGGAFAAYGQVLVQGIDVFVHQVVRLILPPTQHWQRSLIDDEMAIAILILDVPSGDSNHGAHAYRVFQQLPKVALKTRALGRYLDNRNRLIPWHEMQFITRELYTTIA